VGSSSTPPPPIIQRFALDSFDDEDSQGDDYSDCSSNSDCDTADEDSVLPMEDIPELLFIDGEHIILPYNEVVKFNLDTYDKICLLYCCILLEKPDAFVQFSRSLENKTCWDFEGDDFQTQRIRLYYLMFDAKEANKDGVPRHQPTANRHAAPQQEVRQSLEILAELHHSSFQLPLRGRGDPSYFSHAVSILAGTTGVHHAGQLLAQHLVIMGSCMGIFPVQFLEQGHICEDNEKIVQRLDDQYKIFSKGASAGKSQAEIGYDFLAALQHYLSLPYPA
jgi:hypothetical protein